MEIKTLLEGEYVNIELVRNSPTKKLVILSEGEITTDPKYGTKLTVDVEIDGKQKKWSLNKPTMDCFNLAWGSDSLEWIGKKASLSLTKFNGNEMILGQEAKK